MQLAVDDAHTDRQRTRRPASGAIRVFDLVAVVVALPIAIPLGLLIAAAVVIDSPGPVLWRCPRIGKGGRHFSMFKFRTMIDTASGPSLRAEDDPRQTPLGHTLSRCRLNELPQLWHVLKGDMHLVGPRPEAPEFVAAQPSAYAEILTVAPGLTGATQLVFADEASIFAKVAPEQRPQVYVERLLPGKVELDLAYVRNRSLGGDLRILARTFTLPRIVRRRPSRRPDLPQLASAVGMLVLTVLYAAQVAAG